MARCSLYNLGAAKALLGGGGFATRVTTVSPTYAQELQQPEFGFTLDGTFREVAGKTVGILNGIDDMVWNPRTDPHIKARYHPDAMAGKELCRDELVRRFGLDEARLLLGVVSRFAAQKGIDLILAAAERLLAMGWNLFFLGTGDV